MPLGGPSLASLLSWETERNLLEAISDSPDNEPARENLTGTVARCTRYLYNYGTRFRMSDGRGAQGETGEALWADAEDFFDQLDRAARIPTGPSARRLVSIVLTSPHHKTVSIFAMRDAAKRMLAYECSRFLDDHNISDEPWLPYVKWKQQLATQAREPDKAQTIITFNYDCVLEALGLQNNVVLDDVPVQGPHIFKLHGSCNWRHVSPGYGDSNSTTPAVTVENDEVEIATGRYFAATCDATELAIAAPGPGKQYQTARFQALWEMAGKSLRSADSVVILGYRMPPTDARSRRFLLENLPRDNYPIHIVLGHDTNSPDARRLDGVLRMARPNATVKLLPMFAQDYIDVWEPAA
jgi:hypothetical protein